MHSLSFFWVFSKFFLYAACGVSGVHSNRRSVSFKPTWDRGASYSLLNQTEQKVASTTNQEAKPWKNLQCQLFSETQRDASAFPSIE
jgi:hypothetical protein